MAYSKTSWAEGVTALGPVPLNKIESGIADVNTRLDGTLNGTDDPGTVTFAVPTTAPAAAPTAAAATGTGLAVGTYTYAVTFVTGHKRDDNTLDVRGETVAGPTVNVTTTTGNQAVTVTSLPTSAAVTVIGKRIYRSAVGGGQRKCVATLGAAVTTYADTKTDAALGLNEPTANTTGTTLVVETAHNISLQDALFWMSI